MLFCLFLSKNIVTMLDTCIKNMPKCHIMKFGYLEESHASCFGWFYTLCFRRFLKFCCYTDINVSSVHTALCLSPSPLCSDNATLCSLLHGLQQLVRDDSNEGFLKVNEEKVTSFSFPKEASTRQKLIVFLFLVDLFRVDLFTSST